MLYVEFMKNFLLADWREIMAVRPILASWAQKTSLIPTFYTSCTSSSWKIFFSPIRVSWGLLDSFWHPEPKNVWFQLSTHDVRRDHEKFSSRRFRVSWWLLDSFWHTEPKKRLIPTFYTSCTSSSWKIFFLPIRVSWWLLDSFWHPEPKNKWFLLCRHDVRRVHDKCSSRRFERGIGC